MKNPLTSKERRGLVAVAAAALLCIASGFIFRSCPSRNASSARSVVVIDADSLPENTEALRDSASSGAPGVSGESGSSGSSGKSGSSRESGFSRVSGEAGSSGSSKKSDKSVARKKAKKAKKTRTEKTYPARSPLDQPCD